MLVGLREIGIRKAVRYFYTTLLAILYKGMIFPPLRVAFLRLWGAKIGKGTIICSGVRFTNLYRTGYRGLTIGEYCWIGEEVLLDLADRISLGDHVTIAARAVLLTHLNVGYPDHPLQDSFPSHQKPVRISRGSFVGACAVIAAGVQIGEGSFVRAGSVLFRDVGPGQFRSDATEAKEVPIRPPASRSREPRD